MNRYVTLIMIHGKYLVILLSTIVLFSCVPRLHRQNISGPKTYYRQMDYNTNGFDRSYRVHVPPGYNGRTQLPMVVVIHGAFDNAKGMEKFTGFSRLADREGFVVLYPNGIGILGYLQHWNAGHCCGKAAADGIDDVGFIAAAIEDVCQYVSIDPLRIYMVGFSNGGMMTYRFASERGDLLAAAASLAASIGGRPDAEASEWRIADPVKPLPLLVMHGMDDDDVRFSGGRSLHRKGERTYWSVNDSVTFWLKTNGCKGSPGISSLSKGAVQIQTWNDCQEGVDVVLYQLSGWGHVWPGPFFTTSLAENDPLKDFDAVSIIWNFFKRFSTQ